MEKTNEQHVKGKINFSSNYKKLFMDIYHLANWISLLKQYFPFQIPQVQCLQKYFN